jgi:outer membrane lipopolysaccharide assembly protein LptE/RlpB
MKTLLSLLAVTLLVGCGHQPEQQSKVQDLEQRVKHLEADLLHTQLVASNAVREVQATLSQHADAINQLAKYSHTHGAASEPAYNPYRSIGGMQ